MQSILNCWGYLLVAVEYLQLADEYYGKIKYKGDEEMESNRKYERAKKRVEELKAFYIHLTVFISVNIAIFVINMLTDPDNLWFVYTLLGWGVGLTIHFIVVTLGSKWGSTWEDKKMKELMEKDKREDEDVYE